MTMPLAPSDDAKIYYERHGDGDGPPVVFIRGTGGDGTRWMPQIEAYKMHVPCVIFDGRGVGKSDTTPPPYTVAQMAADTIAVLDHLGLESVHISGSSLGGAIGLHMAVHTPERVRTLQMHSSWLATRGYVEFSLGLLKKILEAGGTDFYYEATLPLLFSPRFMTDNFEDLMRILTHMKAHPATKDGLLGQIEANLSHDLSARVASVNVPTLITVGELDYLLPVQCSVELHEAIAGSELVVFPGCGHLTTLENASEFNRVTLEWLRSHL
jgi:pimeloyl-ACP methyl ester carboxylesterase